MSAQSAQAWVAVVGALVTATVGLFAHLNYRSARDRKAAVGASFTATVDALAGDNDLHRMAAAVLLRRYFDPRSEQGAPRRPYRKEVIELIAGMLREDQPARLQKVLADGLRYARDIKGADLQNCNLRGAYLGHRTHDGWRLDLSGADLYEADCSEASFKEVVAKETVFLRATLRDTVFRGADLEAADFREAVLQGARFEGAHIGGARFAGATDIPLAVRELLSSEDAGLVAPAGAVVPGTSTRRP
jgi:hypothetical protein